MNVVIAGGGTGGHLYPGIALAETFRRLSSEVRILFVGTSSGMGESPLFKKGYLFETISAKGFIGKGLIGGLQSIFSAPMALIESLRILKRFSPNLVIGIGGYAAGPVLLAAILLRFKRVILEPNVVPGLSNKLVAPFCHMVVTAFEETSKRFRTKKIKRLGVPVRPEIVSTKPPLEKRDRRTLLILGGSQGSHSINQAMKAAIPLLKDEHLFFIHQTGKKDQESVQAAYRKSACEASVTAFIDDMAAAYAVADLVVSRAGAATLSELAVVGKASLLIPFPFASGHQEENAAAFVSAEAAVMLRDLDLNGPRLAEEIKGLLSDSERRLTMAAAAKRQGNANAAEEIVNACLALSKG